MQIRMPYPRVTYDLECYERRGGRLLWTRKAPNVVTDEGQDDLLDKYLKGSAYTAAFYCALFSTATPLETWAASDIGGTITEITDYDEATREVVTLGTVSSQSVDNSASRAEFTMNASGTLETIGILTVSTKGASTGVLYSVAAPSGGSEGYSSGNVIKVTATFTMATA